MTRDEFDQLPAGTVVEMRDHIDWIRYIKRSNRSFSCPGCPGLIRYIGSSWAISDQIRLVDPLVLLAEANHELDQA